MRRHTSDGNSRVSSFFFSVSLPICSIACSSRNGSRFERGPGDATPSSRGSSLPLYHSGPRTRRGRRVPNKQRRKAHASGERPHHHPGRLSPFAPPFAIGSTLLARPARHQPRTPQPARRLHPTAASREPASCFQPHPGSGSGAFPLPALFDFDKLRSRERAFRKSYPSGATRS
jgi:hypothetical protein